MGGAVSTGQDNDDLINNLLHASYIRSPVVERVFRAVDRAAYFLPDAKGNAYKDLAWKCGHLHLSAPCIYSEVMEGLCLSAGLSFLNLGSGTGYLSTMAGLILGSYGVNHGIEIHEDVIQYANKKLEDFKRNSGAIDEFDFCEPKFTQGNCLCLSSDRQYDRVYCGAACPEPYESYLKNLLRVGGILVMPLNDHLMQIKRKSQTTWVGCSLLPVSFASLVLVPEGKQEMIELLDVVPSSLQSLSRSVIRSILRKNIEMEHPDINKKPQPAKPSKKRERALRRLVPIFNDVGDDPFSSDDEHVGNRRTADIFNIMMDHLRYRVRSHRDHPGSQTDQSNATADKDGEDDAELLDSGDDSSDKTSLSAMERDIRENFNEQYSTGPEDIDDDMEFAMKMKTSEECAARAKEFDDRLLQENIDDSVSDASGGELERNAIEITTADECIVIAKEIDDKLIKLQQGTAECSTGDIHGEKPQEQTKTKDEIDDELQEDMNNLEVINKEVDCGVDDALRIAKSAGDVGPILGAAKKINREKFDSGFCEDIERIMNTDSSDQEHMEIESSSSGNDDHDGKRNKRGSKYSEVRSGAKWRRICFSNPIKGSISSDSDSENVQDEGAAATDESRTVSSPYTVHMRSKIQQLPLPPILRNYLNFYREF